MTKKYINKKAVSLPQSELFAQTHTGRDIRVAEVQMKNGKFVDRFYVQPQNDNHWMEFRTPEAAGRYHLSTCR
jgi:hypothetical protein